jgi:hypothetical protein
VPDSGSAFPSPVDPTNLGTVEYAHLPSGDDVGVAIGPLGTPPPAYAGAGPLPGLPAGLNGAGGGYGLDRAGGGYGLNGRAVATGSTGRDGGYRLNRVGGARVAWPRATRPRAA